MTTHSLNSDQIEFVVQVFLILFLTKPHAITIYTTKVKLCSVAVHIRCVIENCRKKKERVTLCLPQID